MTEHVVELSLYGWELREPMTFFTDALVSLFAFYYFWKLQSIKNATAELKYWKYFLLVLGITTFVAGLSHLFYFYSGEGLKTVGRLLSGGSITLAELAAISLLENKRLRKILQVGAVIQLAVFVFALLVYQNFTVVKLHSLIGFVGVVGVIYGKEFFEHQSVRSKNIFYMILCSTLAGLANTFKLTAHEWFTYHDLGHIFMIFALYFLFKSMWLTYRVES